MIEFSRDSAVCASHYAEYYTAREKSLLDMACESFNLEKAPTHGDSDQLLNSTKMVSSRIKSLEPN